jgi:hypothetical protein
MQVRPAGPALKRLSYVRARTRSVRIRVTSEHQHAHHHKDEVITIATTAIIARFFSRVIAIRLLYNLYYLYLARTLMGRPRLLSLGRAASAASRDAANAAALPARH